MLHLASLAAIEDKLLAVPALVETQESDETRFFGSVLQWLSDLEQPLVANRMAVSSRIATERSALISLKRGISTQSSTGRLSPRKQKSAAAAEALRNAVASASDAIKADRERFNEAEQLVLQILAVASAKQLLPVARNGQPLDEFLRGLWKSLAQQTEAFSATVRVNGLVGTADALAVLDIALTREGLVV